MKNVSILGSTGSIGRSALSVVESHPDELRVVGLAAGSNTARFLDQVERFRPRAVAMGTAVATDAVTRGLVDRGLNEVGVVGEGPDGLMKVATHPDAEIVLCASSGTTALEAVLAAIEAGKTIALANKEILVMAGGIMIEAAKRHGVPILPVDSEHNAIHQCIHGRDASEIRRLILTASGGPFRDKSSSALETVEPEQALRHPTWKMGRKITVDSATLMNKGLEVIEARWLFDIGPERVDVVIHPQSVVHSMVELLDGSVIAQLGVTDMRLPIQYAFSYPDRWDGPFGSLDLVAAGRLDFEAPDHERFPCLGLAYRALEGAPSLPVVLNAANEIAVASFLDGELGFTGIAQLIERVMDEPEASRPVDSLADVREVDRWAHEKALELQRDVMRRH